MVKVLGHPSDGQVKVELLMNNHAPSPPRRIPSHRSPEPSNLYAYHHPASPAKLSTTVVHALADIMGDDVTNTESSLFHSVDLKALDHLFAPLEGGHQRTSGHVAFTVMGYRVTVYSTGHIVITPPPPLE